MKMIFLDTNVLMDWILERGDASYIKSIIELCNENCMEYRVYVSFLSIANMAYILRKLPREKIIKAITKVKKNINVLDMDDFILYPEKYKSPDIEDCFQIFCAERKHCNILLTNNTSHFLGYTEIPVMTAKEFASMCG